MQHLLLYSSANTTTFPTTIDVVTDLVFPSFNNAPVFTQTMYAHAFAACGTNLNRLEALTPSYNAVAPLSIVQYSSAASTFPSLPVIQRPSPPMIIRAGETLTLQASSSSGTTSPNIAVVIADSPTLDPAPPGDMYSIRFTSSTTVTATSWSTLTITTEQTSLPAATSYTLVGLDCQSATGVAVRAYNPNSRLRPGSIMSTALGNYRSEFFIKDRNMLSFTAYTFPSVEVFCNSADSSFVGVFYLKRSA